LTFFILEESKQDQRRPTAQGGAGGSRLKPKDTPLYLDFTGGGLFLLADHETNTITDFDALWGSHIL
jgi:hypothetical protein